MKGLIIQCEVLYFATFRKPASTSLILTFTIPPFTTIRGMIANALGHQQHDHSLQDQIRLSMRIRDPGCKNVEMAKILKLKESPGPPSTRYPSSPMFREYLVNPKYEIFVGGQAEVITRVQEALMFPLRPLYLGQSDDLVELQTSEVLEVEEAEVDHVHTVVEGIHPGCLVEKVPFTFSEDNGKYAVEYKVISIPVNEQPIEKSGKAYIFDGRNVFLF